MCIFDKLFDFAAPNFWSLLISIILIPTIIRIWSKRSKNGFPGIEIKFSKGGININGNNFSSLDFEFTNNTDSIITIRNPRLIRCTKKFPINKAVSARDITDNGFELKFSNQNNQYNLREIDMNPNQNDKTGIALTIPATDDLIIYNPNLFRRLFRWRKYFIIEFYLIKGNKWYHIKKSY
jgi:hypothetical protein